MKLFVLLLFALTPAQERGRQIYTHGTSASGRELTATIGEGGTPFSAAIVPCVNCHGEDGRGRAEANARPADITPETLARAITVNGRTRAPYTRPLLKRAIGMGFDASRNPLNAAMPRYAMTQEDAADLLEFLAMLGHETQPGLTDDLIRIAIAGDDAPVANDARVYGRRIELVGDGSPDVFARIDVRSLDARDDEQREALRAYASSIGAEPALAASCDSSGALLLLTSEIAARCDVGAFAADRQVIVAAAHPPTSAVLAMVTKLLAQLGRDVTRATFTAALERHLATRPVWLMRLDPESQRLIPIE
jgi:hypothetical protein